MKKEEIAVFEDKLRELGYVRYKTNMYESFDYYYAKTKKNDNGWHLYCICFRFWDFEKYQKDAGYSVDVEFSLPVDVSDGAVRMEISGHHDIESIERIETIASMWFTMCQDACLADIHKREKEDEE